MFFEDIRMLLRKIKKESKDSLRIRDRLGVGPRSTTTIQDMLKGVNGSQGKQYFQDDGAEVVLV